VVALAFGLAYASFFPILVLGIFWKKTTAMGATAGLAGGTRDHGLGTRRNGAGGGDRQTI
jgi:Na+(H+)/acetate symporter ActP